MPLNFFTIITTISLFLTGKYQSLPAPSGAILASNGSAGIKLVKIYDDNVKSIEIVPNNGEIIFYRKFSKLNQKEFIFEYVKNFPYSASISKLTIDTGNIQKLTSGINPTVIPETKEVFYYKLLEDDYYFVNSKLDKMEAYTIIEKAPLGKDRGENRIPVHNIHPILQISSSELIFFATDWKIWKYNFRTREKSQTKISNCIPQAWIKDSEQLLCRDYESFKSLYLIDLEAKNKKYIPKYLGQASFSFYAEENGYIGFTMGTFCEMYLYSIEKDKIDLLPGNSCLGPRGIWLPDNEI